jgi:acyl carrier protein
VSALRASLAEAMEFERDDILAAFLRERLAELLDYPPSELPDRDRGFFDLGMESVMVEKFRLSLENELGVSVEDTAVFEHPTVVDLAAHLRGLIDWEDLGRATPDPVSTASGVTDPGPALHDPAEPGDASRTDPELADIAAQLRQELLELGAIA